MTTPRQPGWYDDPEDANAQRYWDGQDWTPHRQRKPAARQAQVPVESTPPPPAPPPPAAKVPPQPPPPAAKPPPPPPPLPPPQAPARSRAKSRVSKVGLVLAGLALVLAIAALVASRVALGTFLPGILLVAAIAIIGAAVTLRSHQSGLRKAMVVTAIVLVVGAAVPASLKVVYPAYNHFFPQQSARASRAGTAGSGSAGQAPANSSSAPVPTSGILVASGDSWDTANFGYIDPTTGKYAHVSSFKVGMPQDSDFLELSPDLTKFAVVKTDTSNPTRALPRAGWIDTNGNFTAVSPAPAAGGDFPQSLPPTYSAPVFDGAGNFYYWAAQGNNNSHLYKVSAGSTSNPQEVTPTPQVQTNPLLNIDGTLNFGCQNMPGKWLGPDYRVTVTTNIGLATSPTSPSSPGFVIAKYPVGHNGEGCPVINQTNQNAVEVFDLGIENVSQPVSSPDATKLAFFNSNSPGGMYVVGVEPNSKATRIASQNDLSLPNLKLIRWS